MRACLDASAAAKLIRDEPESDALAGFLDELTGPLAVVSSMLLDAARTVGIRTSSPA